MTASVWRLLRVGLRLVRSRRRLDGCLGCGCLSLTRCALLNADEAAAEGEGSGWLRDATRPSP